MRVVIGITAYNEARNIGRLLERLSVADVGDDVLERIVVIASGCTDETVPIVRRTARRDERIRLVVEPERRGKAAAINRFIEESRDADVLVLESADTLPEDGAIAAMLGRFADPRVGMVGAHPVPEDDESTFVGYAVQLLWRLHHAVASASPKQGELVAWRNVIPAIPEYAVMDEAYLESAVTKLGYRLEYAPHAIVHNRGPASIEAFVTQRRRNHAGHRLLAAREGYRPATRDHLLLARLALRELRERPGRVHWLFFAAVLEAWASVLGLWDHAIAHRSHAVWTVVDGTKDLTAVVPDGYPPVVVLVVSFNGRDDLLRCLASVMRDAYPAKRVLVVDNGGWDGSAAAVHARFPSVEVLRRERNRGLAPGFNAGVHAALATGCEYVISLNDDVVVANDFIEQCVAASRADPRAASVSGPVFYDDDPERLWYAGAGILWWLGKTYHRGRRVIWGPAFRLPRRVAYTAGAAVLYRADALRDVGDWDEDYFLVFEEADWCVRASRRGWHHLYVPGPAAWHKVSASYGGEKTAPYLYFLFRNNIRFMRRNARPWHWPTFLLFFAAESLLRYSVSALPRRDRAERLRAIALAVADSVRGRYGRGSSERFRTGRVAARAAPPQTEEERVAP